MNELIFRDMRKADIPRVHEIECACFRSPWSQNALLSELKNDIAVYLLAELDGIVVGYAGMWIMFDEAHITNVAVIEPYRRQGIARKMLLSMMERACTRGASHMTLEVRDHNYGAQALYAGLDFVQEGFRPRYYADTGEGARLLWNHDISATLEQNGH